MQGPEKAVTLQLGAKWMPQTLGADAIWWPFMTLQNITSSLILTSADKTMSM